MKYDVFMWTRTYDRDYEWINKPDYMPNSLYKTCQSIIALTEKDPFRGLREDEWYSNFFYLRLESCCVLARMAKTSYTDANGLAIMSLEGVSIKRDSEGRLFHNLQNVVNELMPPSKSFRARFEEEESMPDIFEIEDVLPPFSTEVHDEIHPAFKNNPGYHELLRLSSFAESPSGFIFGPNARSFANFIGREKLGLKYVLDFAQPDTVEADENSFTEAYQPLNCKYTEPVATGKDKVAISLFVQEAGASSYRYRWVIQPWDPNDKTVKDAHRIRFSTRFFDITDRVELARLELQKESLRKYLIENGWTQQEFGLRFERNTFNRE